MFKNEKAQGISITTIIVAAIALVVLVILIAIFTGKMGGFTQQLESCSEKAGECVASVAACKERGQFNSPLTGTSCEKETPDLPYCCVPVGEQAE